MTAALVLFDVENISLSKIFLQDLSCSRILETRKYTNKSDSYCHVVYAITVGELVKFNINFFAEHSTEIGKLLNFQDTTFEIVLTIDFSESSDRVFYSSCFNASNIKNAGPFDWLFLFTNDNGIKSSVRRALPSNNRPYKNSYFFPTKLERKPPCQIDNSHENSETEIPGPTIIINNRKNAGFVSDKVLQITGDLKNICNQIKQFPALLSQVSMIISPNNPDHASARGVQRLMEYLRGSNALMLSWGDGDHLEYELRMEKPEPYKMIENFKCDPSPLGPSVVRFSFKANNIEKVITTRSKLPVFALQTLSKYKIHFNNNGEVNDFEVLRDIKDIDLTNTKTECRFTEYYAEILQPHPSIVETWWHGLEPQVNNNNKTKASVKWKYEYRQEERNMRGQSMSFIRNIYFESEMEIKVVSEPIVILLSGCYQLAWQCLQPENEYTLNKQASQYHLFKIIDRKNDKNYIVFALESIHSGDTIQVTRIQDSKKIPKRFYTKNPNNFNNIINGLKILPILVGWRK